MIKVFRARDLIKYVIVVIIVLIIIFTIICKLSINKKEINTELFLSTLNEYLQIARINNQNEIEEDNKNIFDWKIHILENEYPIIKNNNYNSQKKDDSYSSNNNIENVDKNINDEQNLNNENDNKTDNNNNNENQKNKENEENDTKDKNGEHITIAKTDVKSEIVENKVNPRYNTEYEGVKINNSSEHELNDDIMNIKNYLVNKKKILIYHTHTCESYTPTELNNYDASGNYRTIDLNYSVSKVGDELKKQLNYYGYEVIHDNTLHDYPAYNGSYSRSLKTAEKIINENKEIEISIDLHRDAIGDSSYAPKVKIGEEYVSQLMFVIGTDGSNPSHKNWSNNLKFAIKVQNKANEMYPGLFKPIIVRNSEYNQHISKCACIIEVGATGNTLEESIGAMKYLAKVIEQV